MPRKISHGREIENILGGRLLTLVSELGSGWSSFARQDNPCNEAYNVINCDDEIKGSVEAGGSGGGRFLREVLMKEMWSGDGDIVKTLERPLHSEFLMEAWKGSAWEYLCVSMISMIYLFVFLKIFIWLYRTDGWDLRLSQLWVCVVTLLSRFCSQFMQCFMCLHTQKKSTLSCAD